MLFTAQLCLAACAHERELPVPDPGRIQRYTTDVKYQSDILGMQMKYSVLLPKDYMTDKTKRYPVVYMLHGYGDNNNSWNGNWLHANSVIETLEAAGLPDMIYVFPEGFTSYYSNFYTGKFNYMDMFVEELVPLIDKTYRTIADRQHRSITGYSMGGFGAMVLPEKHPELFLCSAPLSMSFRTDKQYMTESQSGWDGQWGSIFGGKGEAMYGRLTPYYKEHCPFYQFTPENREKLSAVKWFLTCGDDEEQLLIANDSLHVLLRDNGYEHEFRVADGAHTSTYWMAALKEVLPMFAYYMDGGARWEGIDRALPSVPTVQFDTDGTLKSDEFKVDGKGTGLFFVYEDSDEAIAKEAMALAHKPNSTYDYIYLPCNLSVKTLAEWVEHYSGKFTLEKLQVIGFGTAAVDISKNIDKFTTCYIVEGNFGPLSAFDSDKRYVFVQTDNGPYYRENAELYKKCKALGARFEYRVIKGYDDHRSNVLKLMETITQHFIY
ncbi:MAG: hypothetical protein MJY62_01010 [Bacteroidales bacterium]|nr:hypothetical protein [Bacteroidales bacterium]